jgi:drug/metabolite transporter (DMT)-like permease
MEIQMQESNKPGRGAASNAAGVAWAALAVGLFAFIYVSGKLTGNHAPAVQIIWLRYLGGLCTVLLLLAITRAKPSALRTTQAPVHALRAAAGGLGGAAAIYAAAHMPVVSASAIGLLDGVFAIVLGVALLREGVSGRQYMAAAVCLVGALVVLAGKGAFNAVGQLPVLPALAALAGALAVAIEAILIKKLARSERLLPVLFYVNLFGSLLFAVPGLAGWTGVAPLHLALFLLLGPLAIVAQSCNIQALRNADVAVIGPIRYVWIVYAMVFGALLFGERIAPVDLLGAALVLAGGLWLAFTRPGGGPASDGGKVP